MSSSRTFPVCCELRPPFVRDEGHLWKTAVPDLADQADFAGCELSRLELHEDGRALGPAHSPHASIAQIGRGLYSHWSGELLFSTSDNSDPNTNGRRYLVVVPGAPHWSPLHEDGCHVHCNQLSLFDGLLRLDCEVAADAERVEALEVVAPERVQVLKHAVSGEGLVLPRLFPALPCRRALTVLYQDEPAAVTQTQAQALQHALALFGNCKLRVRLRGKGVFGSRREVRFGLAEISAAHWSFQDAAYRGLLERMTGQDGGVFVEIGGRGAQSAAVRKRIGEAWKYLAVDIKAGANVDVVADVHTMSRQIGRGRADVVFSVSVFEHLLMPWQAALEINAVLRHGGLCYAHAPYFWAPHELPWDFFRPGRSAWSALFNRSTGFELLEAAEIGVSRPIAQIAHQHSIEAGLATGPMATAVLARKIGEPQASWSGYEPGLAPGMYPD
jgi:hypothetical protein